MTDIDLNDYEYMTPAQAAEARRMKAELPLWQEMEAMQEATGGNEELDAMLEATRAEMAFVANDVVYFGATNYSGPSSGRLSAQEFAADVDLHRALNGTTGMESEE